MEVKFEQRILVSDVVIDDLELVDWKYTIGILF